MSLKSYYLSAISGKDKSAGAKAFRTILIPLSAIYSSVPLIKEKLYGAGLLKARKLPVPVISVGNLSWGGTGKTPAVIEISKILSGEGITHAVLSRGYGSSADRGTSIVVSDKDKVLINPPLSSDENHLIAANLPGVPVIQDRERYRGGETAIERFNVEALILDDGFQHINLERDLNILLWDSRVNPADSFPIPAGTLREGKSAIKRADIIILTKTNQKGSDVPMCELFFRKRASEKPIFHACHEISSVREYGITSDFKPRDFTGKKAVAFCAIADSGSFKSTIEETGIEICDFISFRDHHSYCDGDIAALKKAMRQQSADFLVTTEKDISRNGEILKNAGRLIYPVISFRIEENDEFRNFLLKPFN